MKIIEIDGDWIKICYEYNKETRTGYVNYEDVFDILPTNYHYYACKPTSLTVRSGPGSEYDKETTLSYGDLIYVDRREDGWYHFNNKDTSIGNTKSGWVMASRVALSPEDSSKRCKPIKMTVVYNGAMNVRSSDSVNEANRIGGVQGGYEFVATGRYGKYDTTTQAYYEWLVFEYNNQFAYILESKQANGTKTVYIKDSEAASKEYEVTSVPVSVSASISIKRMLKPMNGNSCITITNMDNSQKDSMGIVRVYMVPKDGYTFPSDLSSMTIDTGTNSDYVVTSIVWSTPSVGEILVTLQDKNFCAKFGHKPNSTYTMDKMVTAKENGSMSIHCMICNTIMPNSNVVISKLPRVAIVLAKSKASKKISLKWKKVSNAKGYEIKLTLGKKSKIIKVNSAKKLAYTLTKLKRKKTYCIRIRAYGNVLGTNYYSDWSKVKKVKVK